MRNHFIGLVVVAVCFVLSGCSYDIVTSKAKIKQIENKCVYIAPIESTDPHVGKVIGEVLGKEFLRKGFSFCGSEDATIFITGSAFMTNRGEGSSGFFGSSNWSSEAIESMSLVIKNRSGDIIASASYDNKDRKSASKLATELGKALASKLK